MGPEVQDKMFVDRHRETGVYLEPSRTLLLLLLFLLFSSEKGFF